MTLVVLSARKMLTKSDIRDAAVDVLAHTRWALEKQIRQTAEDKGVTIHENSMQWAWWDDEIPLGDEPIETVVMEVRCAAE